MRVPVIGLIQSVMNHLLLHRFCSHSEDALASADVHGNVFVHSLAHTEEDLDLQQVLSLSLGHLHGMAALWCRWCCWNYMAPQQAVPSCPQQSCFKGPAGKALLHPVTIAGS